VTARFLLILFGIFILILFYQRPKTYLRISGLKKKIEKNPLLGIKEEDNTYCYKEKGYVINYRIIETPAGIKRIESLSIKRRLNYFERKIINLKKGLDKFFLYQRWMVFFRPAIFFLLISSIIIFYFGLIETQKTKVERLKWAVATAIGVSTSQIQYIGDGLLEITTQRKTAADKINEPVRYTVNPFKWFFSSDTGFVTRWRGKPYGYVTHPVVYNENGEVWLNKEGTWRHGRFTGARTIEWDTPQGTGIRAGKVFGSEISTQNKKLYVPDK